MDYSTRRRLIDALVVSLIPGSSYLIGFLIQLELGLMTPILVLPGVMVLIIAYLHLVLRKGRKYDGFEHSLEYELQKTLIFVSLSSLTYIYSLNHNSIFLASTVAATIVSLYVFAYRPHK